MKVYVTLEYWLNYLEKSKKDLCELLFFPGNYSQIGFFFVEVYKYLFYFP